MPTTAPESIQCGKGRILPAYPVYSPISSAGVSPMRIASPTAAERGTPTLILSSPPRSNEGYSQFSRKR